MKIVNWFTSLFINVNKVKADWLCTEYGCVTKKSINCGDGLCTKHHLLWHQRLEFTWKQDSDFTAIYIYHCNKNDIQPIDPKDFGKLKLV